MLPPARATALVAALTAASLVSTAARAQAPGDASPPPAAATPAEGTVVVSVSGPDDAELRDSIRELLARLHLDLAAEAGAGCVARVQIDLSSSSDALLVVTDGATSAILLRRSIPRDASPAIVREEIAHAVQSAVESALLAARDRAAQPPPSPPTPPPERSPVLALPPPPEPVKEQPSPPARPSPFGLELMTLAGVGPIADGSGPDARLGLGAIATSSGFLRPSFALSFLYAVPFDTGTVELTSHTSIVSLRALAAIGLLHARFIAVDLGAGGGFDVVTVAPRSTNLPASTLADQTTRTDAMLSAMATAHLGLATGVVLLVSAGVDVDLDSRQYVLSQGNTETDVLAPWRVRPMVLLGFGFTALGDGQFAGGGH
jgi:hypothetical protein